MSERPFTPILLDLLRSARLAQDTFIQALTSSERDAIGSPDCWSAKDHIAHLTFWRQQLILKVQTILRHEAPAGMDDFERLNPAVFASQRQRPWPEVLAESDRAYTELIALTTQLGDDALTGFDRFDWIPGGRPLYTVFMGYCYEHAQQHLAQYYLDRGDLTQALSVYEVWAERVTQAETPSALQGTALYNLACFYATHDELESAATSARQALALYPSLRELAREDPDLIALRSSHPELFA